MPSAKCRPVKIAEAVTQSVSMETSSFFSSPCSSQVRTVLILRTGSAGHGSLLHLALDEHVACKVPQALTAPGGGGAISHLLTSHEAEGHHLDTIRTRTCDGSDSTSEVCDTAHSPW